MQRCRNVKDVSETMARRDRMGGAQSLGPLMHGSPIHRIPFGFIKNGNRSLSPISDPYFVRTIPRGRLSQCHFSLTAISG